MSQKRQPGDGGEGSGEGSPDEKRPRISSFQRVVMEAVKMHNVQKFLMAVEPLIRKVVKEEVELALSKHLACMNSHCGKQIYPPMSRSLQLQFINKPSLPIFTGTKIEGEDCSAISIALVDGSTGAVVTSGPESLMKVEIVVLEGDFEVEEENDWTVEEFKNNIVREREGKRLLLTGDVFLELNEGIGSVGDLSFTDNSSWTRSRKFRLGARVVDGYFNGMRVREAKTEAFMVKDHRGELYKKHYPPSLSDEVWRLEKIGKDGAFHKRLCSENIHTVKDFLTLLCTDALKLRNILGSGMSAKMWEITVEHARTCMINDQMYVYCPDGQGKPGVVFNIVGEVMGILSQQQYISVNELSDSERADARALVKAAFEHWEDVMACDMGVITHDPSHVVSSSLPFGSQLLPDNLYSSFSHKANTFGFLQPGISSLDVVPIGCTRSMDTYTLQAVDSMETRFEPESHVLLSCDAFKDSQELQRISNPIVFDECGSQACFSEDSLQYPDSNVSLLPNLVADSPADLGTAVNSFLRSTVARKRAGWRILICVLKWKFSIRRIVASKKGSCKTRRYR